MTENFKYNVILKISNNNFIISTTYNELKKINIQNWENNRPPDISRIPQIANNIKYDKIILGIIYIFRDGNNYYCYDGIHRLKALEYMDNNNIVGTGGENIKNKYIILNYINNNDTTKIINNFKKINSTIPVPELYTKDSIDLNIRKNLSQLCVDYQKKYPSHFSSSRKPQRPNINRDFLFDILYDISQDCKLLKNYNFQQWINLLDKYNLYVKDNIDLYKLSDRQIKKCKHNNCYIFCSKSLYVDLLKFIVKFHNL